VVQGDMPLLSPNIALHVQISSQKTAPQGVNAYSSVHNVMLLSSCPSCPSWIVIRPLLSNAEAAEDTV
jgi:hypothetical protein